VLKEHVRFRVETDASLFTTPECTPIKSNFYNEGVATDAP